MYSVCCFPSAFAVAFIKGPKYKGKLKYRYNLPLVLVGFLAFAGVTQLALEKRVLSNYFGNIAFAYEDYGYPYCLATTILIRELAVRGIIPIRKSPESRKQKKIFLRQRREPSEYHIPAARILFDPTLVEYLEVSKDPIPTFRKLMEEYSSGYYKVPSVGAGTANTEFESITGMSMHYFGPGSIRIRVS